MSDALYALKYTTYKKSKNKLLFLVDEDTNAFNKIIDGFRMPKTTPEETEIRKKAIEEATKYATEIPFKVMQTAYNSMEVILEMAKNAGLKGSDAKDAKKENLKIRSLFPSKFEPWRTFADPGPPKKGPLDPCHFPEGLLGNLWSAKSTSRDPPWRSLKILWGPF